MKIIDNGPGQVNHIYDSGNVYSGNIGIEIRGHYSSILPQKPYAIETRDTAQNNLNVPLFGFPAENDWVLLANYNDKVFMRNTLAFKLFNEMGQYASRTRFCEVTINGSYEGIYIFGEKIKRDDSRVNIAKLTENENSGEPLTGGYIFKMDYWDNGNSWLSNYHPIDHPNFDIHYVYDYPDYDVITPSQKEYIKDYINSFEAALYSNNFKDPVFGYSPFIDKGAFIDYFLVNEVSRNNDGFKKSFYFHKNRDGIDRRIKTGPVWDFDWAWKNIDECDIFRSTDGSGWAYKVNDCNPDINSPGWHIRLLQDPAFTAQLKCRYLYLRSNVLSDDSLFQYIDSCAAFLDAAQQRHYQRWPILGLNVGAPVVGPIPTTFQGEIDGFKGWISLRLSWLDANMPGTCQSVNLEENKASIPFIFPNPARDLAYLEIPAGIDIKKLEFHTLTGQQVFVSYNSNGQVFSIDLRFLEAGIYICTPYTGKGQQISPLRLIVSK